MKTIKETQEEIGEVGKVQNATKKIRQKMINEIDRECERKLKNGEAILITIPE